MSFSPPSPLKGQFVVSLNIIYFNSKVHTYYIGRIGKPILESVTDSLNREADS